MQEINRIHIKTPIEGAIEIPAELSDSSSE